MKVYYINSENTKIDLLNSLIELKRRISLVLNGHTTRKTVELRTSIVMLKPKKLK